MIGNWYRFRAIGVLTNQILPTYGMNSLAVYKLNSAGYNLTIHNPSGTKIADVTSAHTQSSPLTVNVKDYNYINIRCAMEQTNADLGWKILS